MKTLSIINVAVLFKVGNQIFFLPTKQDYSMLILFKVNQNIFSHQFFY